MTLAAARRDPALALAMVLLSLPPLLALAEAIRFQVLNRNNGALVSSGRRREYLLYVPSGYDGTRPAPLVISLHGAGGWPAQQQELSGWNRLAERKRFLVVYPWAVEGFGPRVWQVEPGAGLARDVRFIAELIDALETSYHVDRERIYVDGLSNGGGMAFALSCTLSERIAAVGMVAAAQTLPWSWCRDDRPVPMMAFHGTADPIVPYHGGRSWVAPAAFPDVPAFAASWARRNRCGAGVESIVAPDTSRREYTGCADDAAVVLYTVRGGGHTWPGGEPLPEWFAGPTSRSLDATARMWAFFAAHPLRPRQSRARQP